MNFAGHRSNRKSHQRFTLRFQRQLAEYQSRKGSAAEGFGLVWEQTLQEVPLDEETQCELYRELIDWAMSDKLFTGRKESELLDAWRQTVHEF